MTLLFHGFITSCFIQVLLPGYTDTRNPSRSKRHPPRILNFMLNLNLNANQLASV